MRRSDAPAKDTGGATLPELRRLTRGARGLAAATILLFFGVGGGWAALAPLDSAVVAEGVVNPEGARRSVQHLEGGIIRAIHVKDGDSVAHGDPLVTLEDVRARADHAVLVERLLHLRAKAARLEAELALAPTLDAGIEASRLAPPEHVRKVVEAERRLFESRRATLETQLDLLGQRVRQLEAESEGLRQAVAGQGEQLDLVAREIAGVRELYEKGLERLPRLLSLQRAQVQVRIERAQNRARIAANAQRIGEAELEMARLRESWRERAGDELTVVRAELAEIDGRLPETRDALSRTVVTAPLAGTVVEPAFTTLGGVIQPGERILDIVPRDADLLIDARVQPNDIDDIRVGQAASVLLSAYAQRTMPVIDGRVAGVSADRLTDARSGAAYFLAKVKVERPQLEALGEGVDLVPGMPARVMIATGARTFFDYLAAPLARSFDRAFREPDPKRGGV